VVGAGAMLLKQMNGKQDAAEKSGEEA
jgi:hypothetical protein